ncbi:phage tail termination protein [Vibrio casei]|uniref:Uncharacterized protein n=1 Tax=Vibrio casei TaxID=673372 RepID=A0A368LHS4_9VIBR|nr:hypothetical protein [Vibrio casei]RCS70175.1 hypothetical protein CIK83_11975 [Vibrio casei]SJN24448.1 hypothetical protein FM109_05495 [Vibrio casei]
MFNNLKEWIESILTQHYMYSKGEWVETEALQFICALYGMGGSAIDVDDRRPRFKVLLAGPQNSRHSASLLEEDIELIIQASMESQPCGAASIRAITEPSGPGYTTENRAWVSVDFQITY